MSYVGNTPTTQGFSPAIDYFNGTGSQTAFTLSRPIASVAQVVVVVNNVTQNPSSAYTVSGNTITFTGAPSSGTSNIYVSYTSPITQVQALTQSPSVIGPMYVSLAGGTTIGGATNPILGLSGAANNYVQGYVNNTTNGVNSSADLVAYPSNGTDASGWVDMGITSPSYSQAAFSVTGPNESYLFGSAPSGSGTTGNLVIATDSTGTANAIQFYTGGFNQAKSAARMTIDGSGNVGIGTSSPNRKLEIQTNTLGIRLNNTTAGGNAGIEMLTGAANYSWIIGAQYNVAGLEFTRSTTVGGTTYSTPSMMLDTSGNLLVGTTSALNGTHTFVSATAGTLSLRNSSATAGNYYRVGHDSSSAFIIYNQAGTGVYLNPGATSWSANSDERLKTTLIPFENAAEKVCSLRAGTGRYLTDEESVSRSFLIAQDVQAVLPEAVNVQDDEQGTLGLAYTDLIPLLTAAIQEQQAIIQAQAADIAALKEKVGI